MCQDCVTPWDGVRNPQAVANMKKAQVGDLAFFYHSGDERAIHGVVHIAKNFYITDNEVYGHFDVELQFALSRPVELQEIRNTPTLSAISILYQPRLSVAPVTHEEWDAIIGLSEMPCR